MTTGASKSLTATVPRSRWATRAHLRVLAVTAAGVAALTGLVALLYATSIHSAAGASDKATTILVGQAVGNGQLLLHGWVLPPGNYWTTDAAFYAIAVRLFGLRPGLLYSEPAVVAAATVSIAILLVREGRRGAAAVAGGVATVSLLVFAPPALALWFVGNGFHIATALYSLVAFAALRNGRFNWQWALAVALLAFGMLGDFEIVAFAVGPLFLAGLVAMLRLRSWRGGLAQVAAAVATFVAGEVVLRVVRALGAFKPGPALPLAHLDQGLTNVRHVFTYGAELVGITNGRFGTAGVPLALLGIHAVGGLCLAACVLAALSSLLVGAVRGSQRRQTTKEKPELWRLDDLLLLATFCSAVPFVLLAGPNGLGIHFLSVPVVFASILTGRMLARGWTKVSSRQLARGLAILGTAVSLTFAAGLGYELALPAPTQPTGALANWLAAHNLRNGIGGYWSAAITTVESSGGVTVRPVEFAHGAVRRLIPQSPASWYAGQEFQFYVNGTSESDRSDLASAVRTWGTPSHVYAIGWYRVLVWSHALHVAPYQDA